MISYRILEFITHFLEYKLFRDVSNLTALREQESLQEAERGEGEPNQKLTAG